MDPEQNPLQEISPAKKTFRERAEGAFVAGSVEKSWARLGYFETLLKQLSPSERILLYCLSTLLALSTIGVLGGINSAVSVVVPAHGGTLVEGEVGTPRFVNPLLAMTQTDQDLTALIYSGLMRQLPDGSLIPDLAKSYSVSSDGTTYTFNLRDNATFHNGMKVTAADVVYTVSLAQSPDIKSPQRADWSGVSASAPDSKTVIFKLPHAYAPFIYDTTLGILPKSLWQNISSAEFPFDQLNTHPIGSGPFRIDSVKSDKTGAASSYTLSPFKRFTLGEPYLSSFVFQFYPNQNALVEAVNEGRVSAVAGIMPSGISPTAQARLSLLKAPLERVFAVFFNQNHNTALADLSVRRALDASIDKNSIVNSILSGLGEELSGPLPPGFLGVAFTASASTTQEERVAISRALLEKGGWKWESASGSWSKSKKKLAITLATADNPQLVSTAEAVGSAWRAIGVQVDVQIYPLSDLNLNVIRPRQYDAVLFGEVVGPALDPYAFWHSSQRNDPGLNLSLYTNSKADTILTTLRGTDISQNDAREKLYAKFATTLKNDVPAVFLYTPDFLYFTPKNLSGVGLGYITTPSDRFSDVYLWHTQTERVWSIFTNKIGDDISI